MEATVIWEFEEIIKSKKRNIVWLAYQQENILEKPKGKCEVYWDGKTV